MKKVFFFFLITYNFYAQSIVLGDSLMASGKYNEAINSYKLASENNKNYKIAKVLEAKGNRYEALKYYQKYLKTDSLTTAINFDYGLLLIAMSKHNEAQIIFYKLVNKEANNPIFLYYLGVTFETLNETVKAFKYYKLASEIDSMFHKSNYKLAFLYSQIKQEKEALVICNRFINQNPEDLEMLKLRAQLYFVINDYSNAITDYERLLLLNQNDDFIYKDLAKAYFFQKEYKKAITIYDFLITQNPDTANYYFQRALCFGNLNEFQKAQIDINESIEIKQVNFENEYFYKAVYYQKNNQLDKALTFYKKTILENQDNIEAHYQVCIISDYKQTNKKNVLPLFESFLKRFPDVSQQKTENIQKRISEIKQELHMQ